jgi:hypothetical protein
MDHIGAKEFAGYVGDEFVIFKERVLNGIVGVGVE